jgi:hypothetical protein
MAIYNLDNYLDKDGLGFPLNFRRGNPNPLDNSSVWGSLAAAQNYAKTDPVAYVGQVLTVVEDVIVGETTVKTATAYVIDNAAGDLKEIGSSPVGDEKTITVSEDGTVSLYGITGLALTREDEDGSTTNINYQPLLVNGKLTWVEPSATTVEGLATEIEGLKTRISSVENAVGKAAEGDDEATGLYKSVADNVAAINAVETKIGEVAEGKTVIEMISDAQTAATYDDTGIKADIVTLEGLIGEESVSVQIAKETTRAEGIESGIDTRLKAVEKDYLKAADKAELSEAIEAAEESAVDRILGYLAEEVVNEKYDTLKEVAAWIESDTTNSAELIGRVSAIEADYLKGADKTELQDAIDDLEVFIGTLPEEATSETVIAYIHEVVDGLKIADYAKAADLTTLSGRVATLEGLVGEKTVSEQIETAIANKVDKAEGFRLMTDAEGSKLAGVAEGAQVNVIDTVDDNQFAIANKHLTLLDVAMGKVNGLSDALDGKVDKVEGSRLLTSDEATKLEKLVLGDNGEVSVSGKVAAGNVDGLDAWITARAGTLEGLSENNLTDTLLGKLNGIAEGAQVNVIDEVSDEFTIAGKTLSVNAIAQGKITGLTDALAGKVDAQDGYRLISESEHEKLAKIADGAQVNVLESVKINGTALEITEKTVDIPVANSTLLGVVMASVAENKIAVAEDGTMEVNSLNVNKLVQTEGDVLILDGGTSV